MATSADTTPPGEGRRASAFAGTRVKRDLGDLVRLAWPVILSRLGLMTMGLVDILVVAHFSTKELGYQAMGWAPTAVIMTTVVGLISGVQVISSRRIGEGRPRSTGQVLQIGILSSAVLGVLAALALVLIGPWGLRQSGIDADLAEGASGVLRVLAWSMPFHIVFTAVTFYLEALSRPKPATLAMWVCNGVNLGLNLLLVPGAFGLPAMGAEGAAWATFGSRAVLAVWLLVYVYRMSDAREWGVYDKVQVTPAAAWELFKPGVGAGASYFIEVSAFNAMHFYAGWLGGLAVAAWSVILNVAAVVFMLPLGLAAATGVLVGRAYGAGDQRGVIRAGMLGFAVCVVMLGVVSLVVLVGAPTIAGLFTKDVALAALVAPGLVLCTLFYIVDGIQVVGAQALRARGDVWMPTLTHMISYLAIMIPLGWVLTFPLGLGLDGILWAVIVASFASAGLLLARFWLLSRR